MITDEIEHIWRAMDLVENKLRAELTRREEKRQARLTIAATRGVAAEDDPYQQRWLEECGRELEQIEDARRAFVTNYGAPEVREEN